MVTRKKYTTEFYISQVLLKNPKNKNLCKYDRVVYTRMRDDIEIFCIPCNQYFFQNAKNHLYRGDGCGICMEKNKLDILKNNRLKQHIESKILCDEETGFYINASIWNSYINGAKQRNLSFDIIPQDVLQKYKLQNGLCSLTGAKLICDSLNSGNISWSIDRIDPDNGYTIENIMLVCKTANMVRNRSTVKELLEFCNMVSSTHNAIPKYTSMSPDEKAQRLQGHSIRYTKNTKKKD